MEKKCTGWTAMNVWTDIHDPQKMNPTELSDPVTFDLAQQQVDILTFI